MLTTYTNPTRYYVRRDLVPTNSFCIVTLLVLRTTWWWPTYKAETCTCILRSVAYYIVIPSDKLLCFWLLVYVSIYIIHCIINPGECLAVLKIIVLFRGRATVPKKHKVFGIRIYILYECKGHTNNMTLYLGRQILCRYSNCNC